MYLTLFWYQLSNYCGNSCQLDEIIMQQLYIDWQMDHIYEISHISSHISNIWKFYNIIWSLIFVDLINFYFAKLIFIIF